MPKIKKVYLQNEAIDWQQKHLDFYHSLFGVPEQSGYGMMIKAYLGRPLFVPFFELIIVLKQHEAQMPGDLYFVLGEDCYEKFIAIAGRKKCPV